MEELVFDTVPIRLIALGGGGFVVFRVIISHLMAYMSGWKRTADQFAMDALDEFPDEKISFGTVTIGGASYTHAMNIAINSAGIYLRPVLLFRAGHRPLFIPWGAVDDVEKNPVDANLQKFAQTSGIAGAVASTVGSVVKEGKLLHDSYKITVGNPSILTLTFSGKVIQRWGAQLESRMDNTSR